MNYDGRYMMKNNYEGSKNLLRYCMQRKIPFLYASSASTYGSGKNGFREDPSCEQALNPYAYSKLQFDRFVRRVLPWPRADVGFAISMSSVPRKIIRTAWLRSFSRNIMNYRKRKITLFEGTAGYENGGQIRDFIYVNDVVNVIFYFWEHPELSGIYNCVPASVIRSMNSSRASSTIAAKAYRIRAFPGHPQGQVPELYPGRYDEAHGSRL